MSISSETGRSTIENPERLEEIVKRDRRDEAKEQVELLKLDGKARELFLNRYTDTFEVEVHGVSIEFYRPVDATIVDLDSLKEVKPDLAERLKQGSELLQEFDEVHTETMVNMLDSNQSLDNLLENAEHETDMARQILSCHSVDDSFKDPSSWKAIFPRSDDLLELFEDFISEGEIEERRQKLNALQNLRSAEHFET